MISITGLESEIPQEELAAFDNGRYEEIVQMLSDLGYLTISDQENQIIDRIGLFNAVSTFRLETKQANLPEPCFTCSFPDDPVETPREIITPRELDLLQLLVGLDGEFSLTDVPRSSTTGIFIRVFHYRLNLLGLYEGPIGSSYSAMTEHAWTTFLTWMAPLDKNKALELTGDLDQIIFTLKENPKFKNAILYFKYHSPQFAAYYSINRESPGNTFRNQLRISIENNSTEFRTFRTYAGKNLPDQDILEKQCESDMNKFMLRLMQLYQWMSGYYLGTIDGEIGKISFSSFLELATSEVENGNIEFSLPLFVANLTGDYWVVNIHYFFDNLRHQKAEQPDTGDLFREFSRQYEKLSPELRQNSDINLKAAWKAINVDKNRDLKSTRYRFRRIYFGIKSMVRSVWRNLKRLFGWLVRKTDEFIENMANLMKNFAKLLFREIREGLQLFARGMAFLFGKRTITTGDYLTFYDFDTDGIQLVPVYSSPDQAEEHMTMCMNTVLGLDFAMTLTGKMIRFILITQGIGWHRVLIEVGIIIKSMFKDSRS